MNRRFRHIVIGVGGVGSAAAYWLARRGNAEEVLALERFELDHSRGASRDKGRVIRYFYHRADYVRLAPAGFAAWADVEREMGVQLVHMTGGITLHPRSSAVPAQEYVGALEECGVSFEIIDGAEIRRRWPVFRFGGDVDGVVQNDSGVVRADHANDAHVAGARARGATVLGNQHVLGVAPVPGGYEVRTADETYVCEKVIVAADAWTNDILGPLGHPINLTVTREQVAYYDGGPAFAQGRFPVWAWMDEKTFYGVPSYGDVGVKASMDSFGPKVHPDTRTFEHDDAYHAEVQTFLADVLPDLADSPLLSTKTCLYTMPPDRDYVVDRLPEAPGVIVVQGAAHIFKFASLFGRVVADLAHDREPEVEISTFTINRPILTAPNPEFDLLLRQGATT